MNNFFILVRVKRRLCKLISLVQAKMILAIHGIVVGKNISVTSPLYIFKYPGSKITLGADVRMHGNLFNNPVCGGHKMVLSTLSPSAVIEIRQGAAISCSIITACKKVTIGERVFLGAGVQIMDTDFHPIDDRGRLEENQLDLAESGPVVVGDGVWIGAEAIVLKGVTIGQGAVVSARAVVTKNVPAYSLVAGVPARVIRSIKPSEND